MNPLHVLNDPQRMALVHGWMTLVWLLLAALTTVWAILDPDNRYLLAWVILMSGYANAAGHWAARQGAAPSAGASS